MYHKATSDYIITAYLDYSSNDVLKVNFVSYNTSYNTTINQEQLSLSLSSSSYTPIGLAFSKSFSMYATQNNSASRHNIWIGTVGITSLRGQSTREIYGVAIRDYSSSYAKIYYSYNCYGSVCLNAEVVDVNYTIQSEANYSIGNLNTNCANLIEVNENIVAISCTTSTYGILSIYKESDMTLYKEIVGESSYAGIASQIAIISSGFYHQVYYNSFNSTNLDNGQISVTEIFVNPNNTDVQTNFTTVSFHSGGSEYTGYGRYFYIDQSNTSCSSSSGASGCEQYKMYIGNMNQNYNSQEQIETLQICTYEQVYSSSSGTCSSPGYNLFSSDVQQESAHD